MKDINLLTIKYVLTDKEMTIKIKNKEILIDKEITKKIREIGDLLAFKIAEL